MPISDATLRNASLSGAGKVITISDDADIQEEIDSADYGDTLVLEEGTYELEPNGIELDSYITLESVSGDPDDVLLIGDPDHDLNETNYLNVKDEVRRNITIRGVTLDSGFERDARDWDEVGLGSHLAVISADNSLIEDCVFRNGTRDCLDISKSKNLTVKGCLLEDAHTDDVLEINDTAEATGMTTTDPRSDNILIEDCTIRYAGMGWYEEGEGRHWCNGIEIEGAAEEGEIIVRDCTIEESVGLDLDVQSEEGIDPWVVNCYNNDFKTANNEYIEARFEGTPGKECLFDEDNTFADDDIDNVLAGHRENIHAPAWGIENG